MTEQELEAERRWDKTFEVSEDLLHRLADEALEEHREGLTEALEALLEDDLFPFQRAKGLVTK